MSFKDTWDNAGTGGKVGIIVAACCVGLLILSVIGGMASPDKTTSNSTDNNTSKGSSTDNNTTTNNTTNSNNTVDSNAEYKNTYNLKEAGSILMDGKNLAIGTDIIATVTEYPSTKSIDEEILDKDPKCIIKEITPNGAVEIDKITNKKGVYEYLANHGMFYSFVHDGKTYIIKTNEDNWKADYLSDVDAFCLANADS